jgi:hypothetical protein
VDAQTLKTKLTEAALAQLAALSLEAILEVPARTVLDEASVVRVTRSVLGGWLESEEAAAAVTRAVERVINELQPNRKTLHEVLPRDARQALRDVLARPFSPDRAVVLTLIDRGPTRALVRQLLLDAILEFGRKISAPMSGMAKGLGSLAKLATETVKSRGGGLGSLVGAVSGEVERQLEKRAIEFVDAALGGIFSQIADAISDPRRADEAAELRLSVFDGAMNLSMQQLSRELMNADVPGATELFRQALRRWLSSAEADAQLRALSAFALQAAHQKTLGALLSQWGLLEVLKPVMLEQLQQRMSGVVQTDAFSRWLDGLFA